tara:strand:- start:224 stop:424 length:201 start_codon:yes stop_codon:yes gene_type:complete
MTNNLMARLRHWQQYGPYRPSRYKEAADRIEKLEAALREIADCVTLPAQNDFEMREIARKALEDTQ